MRFSPVNTVMSAYSHIRNHRHTQALIEHHARLTPRQQRVVKATGLTLLGIVVVQMLYPRGTMLPNTSIVGKFSGFKGKNSVQHSIDAISDNQKITVVVGDQRLSTSMPEIGIKIDSPETVEPALRYPWYQRLLPLSIFSRRNVANYAIASDDAQKTKAFIASLQKYDIPATNAGIIINDQTVSVTPEKEGYSFSDGGQVRALEEAGLAKDFTITLKRKTLQPKVTAKQAEKTAKTISGHLKTQFTISVENQVETVKPVVLGSWITTTADETKHELVIGYDKEKIKSYLQPYADKVYVAGVAKRVNKLDGQVVGETDGSTGRAMKLDASVDAVVKSLTDSQGTAKTIVQAVTPATIVSASYTRTNKGLQALIDEWVKNHKGTYNISLKTLAGDINASSNANAKVYPASIYKLYVADVAYNKAMNGQLDLNAEVMAGKSFAACIELMIVRSDNACAYAVGDAIGWDANNGFLATQGLGSTTLKKQSWNTTANDTANFLIKLQNGGLMSAEYTDTLLSMMSRQIYRSGIPAGSAGSVADKVGFIDSYNHDAGLVYHPNGTYALVIMTSGSNFSNIADLARQISNVMGQ